jgi:hypothetical protein
MSIVFKKWSGVKVSAEDRKEWVREVMEKIDKRFNEGPRDVAYLVSGESMILAVRVGNNTTLFDLVIRSRAEINSTEDIVFPEEPVCTQCHQTGHYTHRCPQLGG